MDQETKQNLNFRSADIANVGTKIASVPKRRNDIFSLFIFLLPILFIPIAFVSVNFSKFVLVTIFVLVAAIVYRKDLARYLIDLRSMPKFVFAMIAFYLVAIISTVYSGNTYKSLVGEIVDYNSFFGISIFIIAFFVTVAYLNNKNRPEKIFKAIVFSGGAVLFYYLFRVLFANISIIQKFGPYLKDNLIGSHIDVSIFLALSVAVSLFYRSNIFKNNISSIFFIVIAMILVGAINFKPLLIIMAVMSLLSLVPRVYRNIKNLKLLIKEKSNLTYLCVLVLSLVFVLSPTIGSKVSSFLYINNLEIYPNTVSTYQVYESMLIDGQLLGVGPGMFYKAWSVYKPNSVFLTEFFNLDFNIGSGFVPTLFVNTGLFGTVALLLFFVFYIKSGIGFIRRSYNSGTELYDGVNGSQYGFDFYKVGVLSFKTSLFMWAVLLFYFPSIVLIFITFVLTAFFTYCLNVEYFNTVQNRETTGTRSRVESIISATILLVVISGGLLIIRRFVSFVVFEKAVSNISIENLDTVQKNIERSIRISGTDRAYRVLSEVYLAKTINMAYSDLAKNNNTLSENATLSFQNGVDSAISAANRAIEIDRADYKNHLALAKIYDTLAVNGVSGSAQIAIQNYNNVLTLVPNSPRVLLDIARMYALGGDFDSTRESLLKALYIKQNFTDAYFTLAQIDLAQNNISQAITNVRNAVVSDPYNAGLSFQLGVLNYSQERWGDAASAFEAALVVVPDYANAKYFLALSYYRLGRRNDAVALFEDIQSTNPDNTEVKFILENLRAGREPFYNARPPISDKPEERSELPIGE